MKRLKWISTILIAIFIFNENVLATNDLASTCVGKNLAECIKENYTLDNSIIFHSESGAVQGDVKVENSDLGAEDNSYRYVGANPNNFVCFGSGAETCENDNLYRIIGVFDGKVKLIKYDYANSNMLGTDGSYDTSTYSKSDYSTYKGKHETINLYSTIYYPRDGKVINDELYKINLNTNFLNNLTEDWKNMLVDVVWSSKGYSTADLLPKEIYRYEHLNTNPSDTPFKVKLMYASDYGFATNSSNWNVKLKEYSNSEILNNNWMYMGLNEWISDSRSNLQNQMYYVNASGIIDIKSVRDEAIRPVFYLSSDVKLASGEGTESDPYRIFKEKEAEPEPTPTPTPDDTNKDTNDTSTKNENQNVNDNSNNPENPNTASNNYGSIIFFSILGLALITFILMKNKNYLFKI